MLTKHCQYFITFNAEICGLISMPCVLSHLTGFAAAVNPGGGRAIAVSFNDNCRPRYQLADNYFLSAHFAFLSKPLNGSLQIFPY